ncbi:ABC transporter substrate-binding protein [Halalkalibacter sp. APA_J-10(15)]|uniref:ABC transporter substrate-binding protein n=1 Tax=Halalkalibacter sp. APA_J-10(15) TaxID=2933805 RepID=UPI001FF10EDF|nr:ABC transporter substrate-binding protein [Halalkalibacter sp. APA_J-10(15)]MCK0470116.1 ABC transporter substrate-binding protein [Halalkalibacter sp. APA_J-10(15)]
MKKFALVLFIMILGVFVVACGDSNNEESSSNQSENDGNNEETDRVLEGSITAYVGFQEDHAVAAIKEFEEETGIAVDMIRMSAGEILARIRAERSNPQADIWYGGPADTFVAAQQEDLLHPYVSEVAVEGIPEEFRDEDGYWTGVYLGPVGFATNQKFLDEHGLEAPTSWDDLLNPAFENEIVMAHPASSGTAYTILYTVLEVLGEENEEDGWDYLQQLHPLVQQYTTSGSAPGRMVGMGEAAVGILFAHDIIKYQKEGYSDLVMTTPEDGTGFEIGSVAIIDGAPNQELAEVFIDWASGPSAQEVGQTTDNFQNLTHKEAQQPEQAIDLDNLNLIESNPLRAGELRQGIIDKWDNEVNK